MAANPLLSDYIEPPYSLIEPGHYKPAIRQRLAEVEQALEAIKSKPASFENTVVPLEKLFDKVADIQRLLGNATANVRTDELAKIEGEIDVEVSDFAKTVFQDRTLGKLFEAVYKKRDTLPLKGDDRTILRDLYREFESSGAFLSEAGQAEIRRIDSDLLKAAEKFRDNMAKAPDQQATLITDRVQLAGLSRGDIDGLRAQAEDHANRLDMTKEELEEAGLNATYIPDHIAAALRQAKAAGDFENCYLFIPERLKIDEWLKRAENPAFRRAMWESRDRMGTQAPYDNEPVIAKEQKLRHEYATLLGYPNYAEFARTRMMKTLKESQDLLKELGDAALPQFEEDMRALEEFAGQKLDPWDVPYWAAQQAKALHGFDENDVANYLPIDKVMEGLLEESEYVTGLDFTPSTGRHPAMHPDTLTYDVVDRATGRKSILHVDLYERPGTKGDGAWMSQIQAGDATRPAIIIFNMNLPKVANALVPLSQLATVYHEMGHALQGLTATQSEYRSLHSTYGPSDFTEILSMINEPRATLHANLLKHARHVETGAPPDKDMLDAMERASRHFGSYDLLKMVQNSLRDLAFHTIDPKDYKGTLAIEASVAYDSPYMAHIPAYRMTRWSHVGADARGGYCAGYVNYVHADVLSSAGAEPILADPYNEHQLGKLSRLYNPKANTVGDLNKRFIDYLGHEATIGPMLKSKGIRAASPG